MADQPHNWNTQLSSDDTQTIVEALKSITREGKRTHTHLPIPLLTHSNASVREQATACLQSLLLHIIPEKRPAHLLSLVNNAINAERGFIALADAEGFQTVTSHNIKSEAIMHESIQGMLFYVQDHVDALQADNSSKTSSQPDTLRSVILVPIVANDEVISIVYSDVPVKLKAFSLDDLTLAETIVETVAPFLPPHLRSQLFA